MVKWTPRLEYGCRLGTGRFGKVWLARDKHTKKMYAIKSISKAFLVQTKTENAFKNEVEIMSRLQHPNVIKLYGWYHTPQHVQVVMEFAPKGDLYDLLKTEGPFSSSRSADYVSQIARGLDYCHRHNIIHRDLKLENLLIGSDARIRITDFGSSAWWDRKPRQTWCGTMDYLAPELVNHMPYDMTVDNWALGVVAFELLTNEEMFKGSTNEEIKNAIRAVEYKFPTAFDNDAREFIKALVVRLPSQRMSLKDVPKHKWISKFR